MNSDYHFSLKTEARQYHFDLVQTDKKKGSLLVNGIRYSLKSCQPEDARIIELFLKQNKDKDFGSVKELKKNFKHILQKNASIEEKISAAENGLISRFPLKDEPVNIVQRMQELGVSGVSFAVISENKIYTKSYGQLAEHSLIQAASVSKTVCALTVLSLIEQCRQAQEKGHPSGLAKGKLIDLDTKVKDLLDEDLWDSIDPEGKGKEMTILHLLSHTAGISGVGGFSGYPRLEAIQGEIEDLEEAIAPLRNTPEIHKERVSQLEKELHKKEDALEKAISEDSLPATEEILRGEGNSPPVRVFRDPGVHFEYSGGGTTILQKIVEELTQETYAEAVQQRVFKKLGMKDSTFYPKESKTAEGNDDHGMPIPGRWNRFPEQAAAGLWTTPGDLAKMAVGIQQSLQGNGIISQKLAEEMITPRTEAPFPEEYGTHPLIKPSSLPNGLGVFVERVPQATYFFHQGENLGFRCMVIANTIGQGAAVMTNSESGAHLYQELIPAIAEAFSWPVDEEGRLPMFNPLLKGEEIEAIKSSSDDYRPQWEGYIGAYHFQGHIVRIEKSSTGTFLLRFENDDAYEITPLTEFLGTFCQSAPDPGPVDFIRFKSKDGALALNLFGDEHVPVRP